MQVRMFAHEGCCLSVEIFMIVSIITTASMLGDKIYSFLAKSWMRGGKTS